VKGLSDCNPAAKRVTVPKAAHAMHIDNPAVFNAAVIRFLDENER
jgi:pimeloyl-ACP methyl ester carboxylesterase